MPLDKPFTVKIVDLGFAKDFAKDNEGSTVLGSPMYMSPDIILKHTKSSNKKYNTSVEEVLDPIFYDININKL